jgi:hypothetical protein
VKNNGLVTYKDDDGIAYSNLAIVINPKKLIIGMLTLR